MREWQPSNISRMMETLDISALARLMLVKDESPLNRDMQSEDNTTPSSILISVTLEL